jgi:hypothetical protein
MKLHTHAVGKISVVVLDKHRAVHHAAASTTDELWAWLQEQDADAAPGTAFCLDATQWARVAAALDLHGTVHVETEFDCDLVVSRHFR